jgi:hypothetical protein
MKNKGKKVAPKSAKKHATKSTRTPVAGVRPISRSEFNEEAEPPRNIVDAGDLQGISVTEDVDSESVAELVDEGQGFEAGIVGGVEDAPNADQGEMKPRKVPTGIVTGKYKDRNRI